MTGQILIPTVDTRSGSGIVWSFGCRGVTAGDEQDTLYGIAHALAVDVADLREAILSGRVRGDDVKNDLIEQLAARVQQLTAMARTLPVPCAEGLVDGVKQAVSESAGHLIFIVENLLGRMPPWGGGHPLAHFRFFHIPTPQYEYGFDGTSFELGFALLMLQHCCGKKGRYDICATGSFPKKLDSKKLDSRDKDTRVNPVGSLENKLSLVAHHQNTAEKRRNTIIFVPCQDLHSENSLANPDEFERRWKVFLENWILAHGEGEATPAKDVFTIWTAGSLKGASDVAKIKIIPVDSLKAAARLIGVSHWPKRRLLLRRVSEPKIAASLAASIAIVAGGIWGGLEWREWQQHQAWLNAPISFDNRSGGAGLQVGWFESCDAADSNCAPFKIDCSGQPNALEVQHGAVLDLATTVGKMATEPNGKRPDVYFTQAFRIVDGRCPLVYEDQKKDASQAQSPACLLPWQRVSEGTQANVGNNDVEPATCPSRYGVPDGKGCDAGTGPSSILCVRPGQPWHKPIHLNEEYLKDRRVVFGLLASRESLNREKVREDLVSALGLERFCADGRLSEETGLQMTQALLGKLRNLWPGRVEAEAVYVRTEKVAKCDRSLE